MTSILDQFERASVETHAPGIASLSGAGFSGYVPVKAAEGIPIFTRQKVDFSPQHPLTHLVASNGHILLAMGNKNLLKIDSSNPAPPEEVDLSKLAYTAIVYRIFLDSSGNHAIISLCGRDRETPFDTLYLHWKSNKPKQLTRYKNHIISAVAWVPNRSSEVSTRRLLLGTTKGVIFEAELTVSEERFFQSGVEEYTKQIFDLSAGGKQPQAVTSLALIQVPPGSGKRFVIFVATPNRLYHFQGTVIDLEDKPLLGQVFNSYQNAPERFQEIPGAPPHSTMKLFYPVGEMIPKSLVWLTEAGVFFAKINLVDLETGLGDSVLIPNVKSSKPRALALTEYHALVADRNTLRGFSVLNEHLVFQDAVSEAHGNVVAVERDAARGSIFVGCEHSIFRLRIENETRDVWRILVTKRCFQEAKRLTENDPVAHDSVLKDEAEYLFSVKNYEESAAVFAETKASFEEVALKFVAAKEEIPLRTYLRKRLKLLKPSQKAQNTMIVAWLLELYLHAVGRLSDAVDFQKPPSSSLDALSTDLTTQEQELTRARSEVREFLSSESVKEVVSENKSVVYDLLTAHGDTDTLLFFALQMRDYDYVIQHHISKRAYDDALDVLRRHCSPESFYKYGPSLMRLDPQGMVSLLKEQRRRLSPAKLMPTLVTTEDDPPDVAKHVLGYLEFAVSDLGWKDQAMHNYLLQLYSKLCPEKILKYLEQQGAQIEISYDPQFALKISQNSNLPRASALVYAQLGLYEEAIDVALKVDVSLAKSIADSPSDDQDLKKKLWLKIAKHVVLEEKDIGKAMEFLRECPLIKIEDILPFFPDFVTIDHFRDAICSSLESYSSHIVSLQEEMEEATRATETIKSEMSEFRNRFAFIAKEDKCCSCGYPLLIRGFYVFPCGHRFHGDCLYEDRLKSLPPTEQSRVKDLKRQMSTFVNSGKTSGKSEIAPQGDTVSIGSSAMSLKDVIKNELDDILASDCLLCGDYAIDSIDKPLASSIDVGVLGSDWA